VAQQEIALAEFNGSFGVVNASLYDGFGVSGQGSWSLNCHLYDSWRDQVRLKFVAAGGTPTLRVVDYFRPLPNRTLCDLLKSNVLHEWSHAPDRWWRIPAYYAVHIGGSQAFWPGSAPRVFLSFWGEGTGGASGGCCSVDQLTAYSGWRLGFQLFIMPGR
jgi:hypothetical protein